MMETKARALPDSLTADPPNAVRVAHVWGHGEWHHPEDRPRLECRIKDLNAKYGTGTHWIEVRDSNKNAN